MIGKIKERLPDLFPMGEVRVRDEEHVFRVFETDDGSSPKYKYKLDKAPINTIQEVEAEVDGQLQTLTEGTDYKLADLVRARFESFEYDTSRENYELVREPDSSSLTISDDSGDTYDEDIDWELRENSDDELRIIHWIGSGDAPDNGEEFTAEYTITVPNSQVDFSVGGDNPDDGTTFYVTYYAESIISRFIEAHEEQVEEVSVDADDVIEGRFITQAQGRELDELAKLFGELGKRRGRSDAQYRIYLKSIARSFAGRGTLSGIRFAVSSGLGISQDRITIFEDFENNEYDIQIDNFSEIEFSDTYTYKDGVAIYDLESELSSVNGNDDIRDESGDLYEYNVDFTFNDTDRDGNFEEIEWLDGGSHPDPSEAFTVYFPIQSDTITTLAELADPSGVTFIATRYNLEGDTVLVEGPGLSTTLQHTGLGDGDTIGDGAIGTRDDEVYSIHNVNGDTILATTTGVEILEEYGIGAANIGVFTPGGNEKGSEDSQTTSGDVVVASTTGTSESTVTFGVGSDTIGAGQI